MHDVFVVITGVTGPIVIFVFLTGDKVAARTITKLACPLLISTISFLFMIIRARLTP